MGADQDERGIEWAKDTFAQADTNQDGKISAEELGVSAEDLMMEVDKDQDGFLTLEEVLSTGADQDERGIEWDKDSFGKADTNQDGKTSVEEHPGLIEAADNEDEGEDEGEKDDADEGGESAEDLMMEADKNQDGFLTLEEVLSTGADQDERGVES